MVQKSVKDGGFPNGVTKGLIILLPKCSDLHLLNNWRPITLLNISYKIFAKALQLCVKDPLSELISPDQSAYLKNRFILDNIMLTQETLSWAKKCRQDTIFFKLDFSKAFDRIDWHFLFCIMSRMGFPNPFIDLVKLTLKDTEASININGHISTSFPIERGVRQGCPLASLLFWIIREVLHAKVHQAQEQDRIRGVELPASIEQQLTLQFADDTSFTIGADHRSVSTLVHILHTFTSASGPSINWAKSGTYWVGRNGPPGWANNFGWTWVADGHVSKLLGTPFGLSITTGDTD